MPGRGAGDPAKDAARLLGWAGLAVLMVGAPLVSVLSRSALSIALPVGAAILGAGYALSVSAEGLRALRRALAAPIGLVALFVAGWAALSLAWTPFPELAAPRLLATLATALIAAVAVAHLPERGAVPRQAALTPLALLPGGVAVTALALAALALAGPASFRGGTEFEPSLVESSAITLTVLAWPALGALALAGRWRLAATLAALVAATLLAAAAILAAAVFALAAVAFALALGAPGEGAASPNVRRVALVAAAAFAALVLLAPLLPFALAPLAQRIAPVGRSTVAAMADWRALVAAEPLRLVTGHGLDAARHGVEAGFLPPHAPRTVLFEAWYDLGALGAAALAALLASAFLAAGRAAPAVAPALVAGLVAVLAVAALGVATTQPWFVTLVSLQAVALALLLRTGRSLRPSLHDAQLDAPPDTPPDTSTWQRDPPSEQGPPRDSRAAGAPRPAAETHPPDRLRPIRERP